MQGSSYYLAPPGLRCASCSSPASVVKVDDFVRPDADGFRGVASPLCDGCCAITPDTSGLAWSEREHYRLRGN